MFCCTLLYVPSSFAIILMGKRELVALLSCLPCVSWLLCGSSSWCHGFVCSLWLWYFLIILTYCFYINRPKDKVFGHSGSRGWRLQPARGYHYSISNACHQQAASKYNVQNCLQVLLLYKLTNELTQKSSPQRFHQMRTNFCEVGTITDFTIGLENSTLWKYSSR